MGIKVKYNNIEIIPTPLVSRSYQFIDYGNRWGQQEKVDLTCYLTGYSSVQNAIDTLNTLFANQFYTLEVFDEQNTSTYKWPNIVLQEVNIQNDHFAKDGMIKYDAKFVSYQVPSGVIDPSNEYSFSEGEDGLVTINHRISARGIRTSNSPIDNAINFVNAFIKKNPYTACTPGFISNGSGILFSINETIDRPNGTYSVNEIYKYITGSTSAYLQTTSLNVDDSTENDYKILEIGVKLQGSPVNKNLSDIQTAIQAINIGGILQDYGINSSNIYVNSNNLIQNSGENFVELKANYISGYDTDISGYFDYVISLDYDNITNKNNWKIDGEFLSKGPINFRQSKISSFKTTNQGNGFETYLSGLIIGSPLYSSYGGSKKLSRSQVSVFEDTGNAILKLSASYSDYNGYGEFVQPKYSVEVEPSRWIYELLPSANIEGMYTAQDLQMRNKSQIKLSFNANSLGLTSKSFTSGGNILDTLSGLYVGKDSYLLNETVNSGINNITLEKNYIGEETVAKDFLKTKVFGSFSTPYVRPKSYKFGY